MRRPEEVRIALVTLSIMLAFATLHTCQAKRGCSAFGHSCFGGHGKRMDPSSPIISASAPEEVAYDQQAGLRDVVFTAPRSVSDSAQGPPSLSLLEVAAELQRQHQQDNEKEGRLQRQDAIYGIAPYFRQWLQAYRNSQEFRSQNNM